MTEPSSTKLSAALALVEVITDEGVTGYGESVAGPSLAGVLYFLKRSAVSLQGSARARFQARPRRRRQGGRALPGPDLLS